MSIQKTRAGRYIYIIGSPVSACSKNNQALFAFKCGTNISYRLIATLLIVFAIFFIVQVVGAVKKHTFTAIADKLSSSLIKSSS